MKFKLTITHLYPDKMNLYGDLGNIIVLERRARARGIEVTVNFISTGDTLKPQKTDIYFFGGGQDAQQVEIGKDMFNKKESLLKDLHNNVPALAICGGYQLLGQYYLTGDKQKAEGLGFLPIETVAPGTDTRQRCIGNISVEIINEQTKREVENYYKYPVTKNILYTLTGFENHSGRTKILTKHNLHLGRVLRGIGDSEIQGYEGIRYKNTFGSYMHGAFLPKNPHIADLLLSLALQRRYKEKFISLPLLDDDLEWRAHEFALSL